MYYLEDRLQRINLEKAERPGVKFSRKLWTFGVLNFEFGKSIESNSKRFWHIETRDYGPTLFVLGFHCHSIGNIRL